MRDGQGNKLTSEEAGKVTSAETAPGNGSVNKVSVDPTVSPKPVDEMGKDAEPPESTTAPKF